MFWPWKFGLTVAAAWLTTAITAELFRGHPEKSIAENPGALTRRAITYAALLFAVIVMAGVVTYYYHMNDPAEDENGDAPVSTTSLHVTRRDRLSPTPSACLPGS